MKRISKSLSKCVQLTRLRIIPILLILKKNFFLIVMGKRAQGLSNFPKLSLYTQVQISVVSYFSGNRVGEFSITGHFNWMEQMPETWMKTISLFINIKKKKK